MRRIAILIACLLIACLLAMPASAATAAQRIESVFTVAANGDITVSLQLSLYLDAAVPDLAFPVPEDAKRITVNGGSARTRKGDDLLLVDLSKVCATPGAHTVTITYQTGEQVARKVVDDDGKTLPASQQKYYFHLPLLCSFFYPVESMKFTILLPRELTVRPQFLSGYHQELADAYIDLTYDGNQITGVLKGPMQDRETLEMVLPAEEMFPGLVQRQQAFGTEEKIMCLLAAVSLLYWLLFLRTKRAKPGLTPTPPDGLTAGQLGSVLTGQGADLTMMVLSWAQLGYILIHLDDHGRVMLHKRMEMGNERSAFENKCFRSLFGKRRMVDGTGGRYARLCRSVAASKKDVSRYFLPRSGNPGIFRGLAVAVGALGGVSLGAALGSGSSLYAFLIALFALLGGGGAFAILQWAKYLRLRGRGYLLSLSCAVVWLGLSVLAQDYLVAVCVVLYEVLAGYLAVCGGRRSESGMMYRDQALGLRRYLKKASEAELHRAIRSDPGYFFTLAPCAFALGVEQRFARSFGSGRISACPYLTTGMDGHLTAEEWCRVMARAVDALDRRQKRLPYERLFGRR